MIEKKYLQNPDYLKHLMEYGKPVSIRLNDEETEMVRQWQQTADIGSTSEAIKTLMKYGFFVLHGKSTEPVISRLFKKERHRLV